MAATRIIDLPRPEAKVAFNPGCKRTFLLTVDVEEEFDWQAPLDRHAHSLKAVHHLKTFQEFCEGFGVIPVYLVDYPVATSPAAAEALGPAIAAGRAEIGVQLHGWVNPPFAEDVNEFNSYAGNLPPDLETAKFTILRDAIISNFGAKPLIFRSGRYGAGPQTAEMLKAGGISIDTSVRARFDYSSTNGPNYREFPVTPYWLDKTAGLLELPLTSVFWGLLRGQAHWLYPMMWRVPRLRGVLARLGMMERIPLTPEGVNVTEAKRGIDNAIKDDLPILVFSFHSPSLAPGCTPYVRCQADLDRFYDWWRQVFAHLHHRDIAPTSVRGILDSVALA